MASSVAIPTNQGHTGTVCSANGAELGVAGIVGREPALGIRVDEGNVLGSGGGLSPAIAFPCDTRISAWLSGPNFGGACIETSSKPEGGGIGSL